MSAGKKSTRREVLGQIAAPIGLGLLAPVPGVRAARAQTGYKGDLVVVAQAPSTPDRALPVLLEQFQSAHPGVNVKLISYPGEKFPALFSAAQVAGERMDLMYVQGLEIRRYAANGTVMPLDDVVKYQNRFLPEATKPARIGGKLYGVPIGSLSAFPIYVNKALLARAKVDVPKTHDELKQVGKALETINARAFTAPAKNIVLLPVWFATTFAQTTGNRSVDRTQEILMGKGKFTDPDVVQAFDLIAQFARDGLMPPTVLGLDNIGAINEFVSGKAAFMMYVDALSRQIMNDKPPAVDLDMMLMPQLVAGGGSSQFPGGPRSLVAIPTKIAPERRQIALELMDFLTSDAQNPKILELNGGNIPVNVKAPVSPSNEPFVQKVRASASKIVLYLDWILPPQINRAILNEGIQALFAGKANAKELARDAQTIFDRLVTDGYKFVPYG